MARRRRSSARTSRPAPAAPTTAAATAAEEMTESKLLLLVLPVRVSGLLLVLCQRVLYLLLRVFHAETAGFLASTEASRRKRLTTFIRTSEHQ